MILTNYERTHTATRRQSVSNGFYWQSKIRPPICAPFGTKINFIYIVLQNIASCTEWRRNSRMHTCGWTQKQQKQFGSSSTLLNWRIFKIFLMNYGHHKRPTFLSQWNACFSLRFVGWFGLEVRLVPWAPVQITGTHNQQKRKLFCSQCSSTQQGMISHLNCLNHSVWFHHGRCLIRIAWCIRIQRCASVSGWWQYCVCMQVWCGV